MAAAVSPKTGGELGKIRSFLLDHERLLIVAIVAVVIWVGYVKITNIIAEHDNEALQAQKLITDAQLKANQQLAAQVAQDAAQMKALSDKVEAQNQQLANANIALATALSKQQHTDATLPPTELAQRWAQITPNMPAGGVQVSTNNAMTVTQAGAVATVQQLEKVPVLTQQLANETTQKENDDQLVAAGNKSIADLNLHITGLNSLIVDKDKQCQLDIKVVKDEARKSKRRWFIIGYIAGFASKAFLSSKGF